MGDKSTVLIVDDHEDALAAYSFMLEQEGYAALSATTGEDCISIAKEKMPDLILLDVRLPDISGIEVCKQIKADRELAGIFVMLVSGVDVSTESQVKGFDCGADGYITKPVEGGKLLAQIRALLRIGVSVETALADRQIEEIEQLERFSRQTSTPVAAHLYGARPLRESFPDDFNKIVSRYGEMLDLALDEQAYKINNHIPEGLHAIAERLGFLKAGPRDVVDIHTAALKAKTDKSSPQRARAYISEGRIRLIEIMGYMVSFYRNQSLGISRIGVSSIHAQVEDQDQ